jgi:hypothetical protein
MLLVLSSLLGCAADNVSDVSNRLVEEKASYFGGVVYGEEGSITYEVEIGEAIEMESPEQEDLPLHEIDIRILDANGAPLLTQIGGHSPMNSDWSEEYFRFPPAADREKLLVLVPAAQEELEKSGVEEDVLMAFEDLVEIATGEDTGPLTLVMEEDGSVPPPAATYSQVVNRKKKNAWNLPGAGEHSAIYVKVYNSSNVYMSTYWTCNHGTCANSGTMSTYATNTFTTSSFVANGLCTTTYGILSGQHVCNDDTYIQYSALQGNTTSPSTATCSDNSLRTSAP